MLYKSQALAVAVATSALLIQGAMCSTAAKYDKRFPYGTRTLDMPDGTRRYAVYVGEGRDVPGYLFRKVTEGALYKEEGPSLIATGNFIYNPKKFNTDYEYFAQIVADITQKSRRRSKWPIKATFKDLFYFAAIKLVDEVNQFGDSRTRTRTEIVAEALQEMKQYLFGYHAATRTYSKKSAEVAWENLWSFVLRDRLMKIPGGPELVTLQTTEATVRTTPNDTGSAESDQSDQTFDWEKEGSDTLRLESAPTLRLDSAPGATPRAGRSGASPAARQTCRSVSDQPGGHVKRMIKKHEGFMKEAKGSATPSGKAPPANLKTGRGTQRRSRSAGWWGLVVPNQVRIW